jgi:fermentation-respiration switch protein FrsA (DUF1100 family)
VARRGLCRDLHGRLFWQPPAHVFPRSDPRRAGGGRPGWRPGNRDRGRRWRQAGCLVCAGEGRQADHPQRGQRRQSRTQNRNDPREWFGVFYLNNRGYGGSGGSPTEENNAADAIAAYDYLTGLGVPADRIVAYGESLGSGQAVRLAAARPVAAIVLEAPLTSTVAVARSTYFWLPLGLLITDTYNNEHNIRSVTAPVLVLHGEQDGVIPVEMGLRVYRAANEPRRIELFPEGAHSDLFDHGAWEKTRAFLASPGG